MDNAIDTRTDQLTTAAAADRWDRHRFLCPYCLVDAHLRAGNVRSPHFAHDPHKGTEQCEHYHPGQSRSARGTRGYENRFVRRMRHRSGWTVFFQDSSGGMHCGIEVNGNRPDRGTWRARARLSGPTVSFVFRNGRYRQISNNLLFTSDSAIVLTIRESSPHPAAKATDLGPFTIDGIPWHGWQVDAEASPSTQRIKWLRSLGVTYIGKRAEFELVTPPREYDSNGATRFSRNHRVSWRLPEGSEGVAIDLPGSRFTFKRAPRRGDHYLSIVSPAPGFIEARLPECKDVISASFEEHTPRNPPASAWHLKVDRVTVLPFAEHLIDTESPVITIHFLSPDLIFDCSLVRSGSPDEHLGRV